MDHVQIGRVPSVTRLNTTLALFTQLYTAIIVSFINNGTKQYAIIDLPFWEGGGRQRRRHEK